MSADAGTRHPVRLAACFQGRLRRQSAGLSVSSANTGLQRALPQWGVSVRAVGVLSGVRPHMPGKASRPEPDQTGPAEDDWTG